MFIIVTLERLSMNFPYWRSRCLLVDIRDFAIFAFERTYRQPLCHLLSHLVMQRVSSEATICPDRMMGQVRQRAAMLFFLCSSNKKVFSRYVLYVKRTLITQLFLDCSTDKTT